MGKEREWKGGEGKEREGGNKKEEEGSEGEREVEAAGRYPLLSHFLATPMLSESSRTRSALQLNKTTVEKAHITKPLSA